MKSKEFATATDIFLYLTKKGVPKTSELLVDLSVV